MSAMPPEGRGQPQVRGYRSRTGIPRIVIMVMCGFIALVLAGLWINQKIHGALARKEPTPQETNVRSNRIFSLADLAAPPEPPVGASFPASSRAVGAGATATAPAGPVAASPARTDVPVNLPPLPRGALQATPPESSPPVKTSSGDRMMLTGPAPVAGATQQTSRPAAALSRGSLADEGPLRDQLVPTSTGRSTAGWLGNRDFVLPKGTLIDCILNTALVSTVSGMTTCVIDRDVYSDNGRVVLIEKGALVTGEYTSSLRQGQERLFVVWDRIKTPMGVVIKASSPAADQLGANGVPGYVENHWAQRVGGAIFLSLVQDAIDYKTQQEAGRSGAIVLPNSSNTVDSLASKILDATINIPPTLSKEQGAKVSIYVSRDLDFSTVYELHKE